MRVSISNRLNQLSQHRTRRWSRTWQGMLAKIRHIYSIPQTIHDPEMGDRVFYTFHLGYWVWVCPCVCNHQDTETSVYFATFHRHVPAGKVFYSTLQRAKSTWLDVLSPRCKVFQPCWNPKNFAGCTPDWQKQFLIFIDLKSYVFPLIAYRRKC